MTVSNKCHQDASETARRGSVCDGGKIEWKLSEGNIRAVSRENNELIGEYKMAAADVIFYYRIASYNHILNIRH